MKVILHKINKYLFFVDLIPVWYIPREDGDLVDRAIYGHKVSLVYGRKRYLSQGSEVKNSRMRIGYSYIKARNSCLCWVHVVVELCSS